MVERASAVFTTSLPHWFEGGWSHTQQTPATALLGVGWGRRARTPRRWVGLDLGSHAVKLVELEQTTTGVRLIRQLIQELPLSTVAQPIDRASASVVGWLESALREMSVQEVHAAISGPQVVVRRLHVPCMAARELLEGVTWQLKDQLTFPVQEAVCAVQVVGEVWDKDIKKLDVLAAAVARGRLEELVTLVERAGARIVSLVPASLGLWSCLRTLVPETQQGGVVVMELGERVTHLVIAKEGHLRLVRDLALGTAHLTEALTGAVATEHGQITIDQSLAETLTHRYGVVTALTEGITEEGVPLVHLAALMRPVLEHLLTEASRFLDFYKVHLDPIGVSRVFLCGDGSTLKQLPPFLSDGLGVPVELFNPLLRIPDRAERIEPEVIAEGGPRLAVALGVALDHGERLTLLSPDRRLKWGVALSPHVVRSIAMALVGGALVLYAGLWMCVGVLERRLEKQQAAWQQAAPLYSQARALATTRHILEATIGQLQQFLDQEPVWEGVFKELGTLIPPSLVLTTLMVTPESPEGSAALRSQDVAQAEQGSPRLRIRLSGIVPTGHTSDHGGVFQFVESLEQSPLFTEVALTKSEQQSGEGGATVCEITGLLE